MDRSRLVFVYNADAGIVNALRDIWTRVTKPAAYPCSLCALTYGATGMSGRWKGFTTTLGFPVVFLHRDEFGAAYGAEALAATQLPVALLDNGSTRSEVVSAAQMRSAASVDDLIAAVNEGLRRLGKHG